MKNYQGLINEPLLKATVCKMVTQFDEFQLRKYSASTVLEFIENGTRSTALLRARNKLKTLMINKNIIINESAKNRVIPEIMIEPFVARNQWKIEFLLENNGLMLPDLNNEMQLKNHSQKYYGIVNITGIISDEKIIQKMMLLKSWIAKEKLVIVGKPKIAIYQCYFKIACLKRVEIYIEVQSPLKTSS
jgi:hypothetical protein